MDTYFTVAEAAIILGVSRTTLKNHLPKMEKALKHGRAWVISPACLEDLRAYIAATPPKGNPQWIATRKMPKGAEKLRPAMRADFVAPGVYVPRGAKVGPAVKPPKIAGIEFIGEES
jgi:hypothetical protein